MRRGFGRFFRINESPRRGWWPAGCSEKLFAVCALVFRVVQTFCYQQSVCGVRLMIYLIVWSRYHILGCLSILWRYQFLFCPINHTKPFISRPKTVAHPKIATSPSQFPVMQLYIRLNRNMPKNSSPNIFPVSSERYMLRCLCSCRRKSAPCLLISRSWCRSPSLRISSSLAACSFSAMRIALSCKCSGIIRTSCINPAASPDMLSWLS